MVIGEQVKVGAMGLAGEVIGRQDDRATVQVFEGTDDLDLERTWVRFLEQGHEMLERKRELLTRVVHERLRQYQALRGEASLALTQAYRWLAIAQIRIGSHILKQQASRRRRAQHPVSDQSVARTREGLSYLPRLP